MNYKAFIDYLRPIGIHAGLYFDDDVVSYVCDTDSRATQKIKGYLEVRLNENVPRTWNNIKKLLDAGYFEIGKPLENSFHHTDTSLGSVELYYRLGVPETADIALTELRSYWRLIVNDSRNYEIPE